MKPYPASMSESDFMALWKRRESKLLPDEPRDDSVPMELQEEDRELPLPWNGVLLALAGVVVVVLVLAVRYGLPA